MRFIKSSFAALAIAALVVFIMPGTETETTPTLDQAPIVSVVQAPVQNTSLDFKTQICIDPIITTCLNYKKNSTGTCTNKQQYTSTHKECHNRNYKITGTSNCSTTGNVKKY